MACTLHTDTCSRLPHLEALSWHTTNTQLYDDNPQSFGSNEAGVLMLEGPLPFPWSQVGCFLNSGTPPPPPSPPGPLN